LYQSWSTIPKNKLGPADIAETVLVGGSTRISVFKFIQTTAVNTLATYELLKVVAYVEKRLFERAKKNLYKPKSRGSQDQK
jgi:molecular chaperone DnaK (HSP70)